MSRFKIAVIAAALGLGAPWGAHAAGLGRLTVLSPLGQPLNAIIEIVATQPGEEAGLSASIASLDAFREAGIEPSSALSGLRFAIERRDGRPVIHVTSTQPVNEPFVEMLVQLQWNTGRLVRDYTFLLDPPGYKGPQTIAAAPETKSAAPVATPLPPVEPKADAKPSGEAASVENASASAQPSAKATYEVKPGDTLGAIARSHLAPGVTLNQMLIALYRANEGAFIRNNLNLVRSGRILTIPDASGEDTISVDEANRLVETQRAEFEQYRSRLAAVPTPAETAPAERTVAGKIEAPAPAAPAAEPEDRVKLSKADPEKSGSQAGRAAQDDDAAARERALQEAQSRVADLEKNVSDLQKLLELKNQQLAELEKRAGGKAGAAAATTPSPTQVPASSAAASAPVPPAASTATPSASPSQTQVTSAPAVESKPTPPAESKPVPAAPAKSAPTKAKPRAAPPAPSLLDEFLENPIALAGLGAVVLLLILYGLWAWRRKKSSQAGLQDDMGPDADPGSVVAPEEAATTAQTASTQPAAISEPDEVDPIAEADVYMAYGRDAQAEEILKEALQKNPSRTPLHLKLLEIYAHRKDSQLFEQSALKLKGLTNGAGPEWDKAAALGRSIDPSNGLYAGTSNSGHITVPAPAAAAAVASTPTLDFDLGAGTSPGSSVTDISLDDRELGKTSSVDIDLSAPDASGAEKSDFTPEGTLIMDKQEVESTITGLDFDLSLGDGDSKGLAPAAASAAAAAAVPAEASGALDFDLDLDLGDEKAPDASQAASPIVDLSDISLDLGLSAEGAAPATATSSNDPKWQEVATKLDLAKAYEEMGDKDGARELLNEVMKDGDSAQQGQARQLLAKLA